jgi:hypothetical protein
MARKQKETARLYGPPLQRPSNYVNPITPEMIEHMKNCEAREWIRRYKEKTSKHGSSAAAAWWAEMLEGLRKIRGESATLDLRQRMKAQSENRT